MIFRSPPLSIKKILAIQLVPTISLVFLLPRLAERLYFEWHDNYYFIVIFILLFISYLLYRLPRQHPYYRVSEDTLHICFDCWTKDEYPLADFKNNIEVKRELFEWYLLAPGYKRYRGKIPLYLIDKETREQLLAYLEEKVSNK